MRVAATSGQCTILLLGCHACCCQVYGSDYVRGAALRAYADGKLRVDATPVGPMMPRNTLNLPNANDARAYPDNQLFLGGGTLCIFAGSSSA